MRFLDYELAKGFVEEYRHEKDSVLVEHGQAMDCHDCEMRLGHGIRAFRWVQKAEQTLIEGVTRGIIARNTEIVEGVDMAQAMESLYRLWLTPCERAEEWIRRNEDRGFRVENAAEFRECCDEARDWIERQQWQKLSLSAMSDVGNEEPW